MASRASVLARQLRTDTSNGTGTGTGEWHSPRTATRDALHCEVIMSISPRGLPDHATMVRWQHKLASRIVIQAFKDLKSRSGPEEDRASAREFLAGSAMLRYWCQVGSLDVHRIMRRVRRGSTAM